MSFARMEDSNSKDVLDKEQRKEYESSENQYSDCDAFKHEPTIGLI